MFLSLTATTILTIVCVAVIAIVFFAYASVLRKNYLRSIAQYDCSAKGIVSKQWKTETPLDNGETSTTWYVDYQYTINGQEYEKNSGIGHFKKMFQDGDQVTILYKSDDPDSIYVVAENTHDKTVYKFIYGMSVTVIVIGALLLFLATRLA